MINCPYSVREIDSMGWRADGICGNVCAIGARKKYEAQRCSALSLTGQQRGNSRSHRRPRRSQRTPGFDNPRRIGPASCPLPPPVPVSRRKKRRRITELPTYPTAWRRLLHTRGKPPNSDGLQHLFATVTKVSRRPLRSLARDA